MSRLLDIKDLEVAMLSSGEVIRSPGYASLENKGLIFGSPARAISRLNPGLSANQYWRDLSTQKSSANLPGIRHQADLAWNHLKTFDAAELQDVSLVAVPSHYSKDQIALLSGVLKSLEVSNSLICKRSLLMAVLYPEAEYQVDFQLHQLVVTKLEKQGAEIICGDMVEFPGLGLLGCSDALLKGIQARFIDKTRFDPLHHAITEQQLFNQLMEQLLPQKWQRVDLKIELEDQKNSIELSEQQLEEAASEYLAKIKTVLPSAPYVADRIFGNLPIGVEDGLYLADEQIVAALDEILPAANPGQEFVELTAVANHASSSPEDSSPRQNEQASRLSGQSGETSDRPSMALQEAKIPSATHLLVDGRAIPLSGALIMAEEHRLSASTRHANSGEVLGRFSAETGRIQVLPETGLHLNGAPISSATDLSARDIISHQDYAGTLVAIEVVD